MPSIQAALVSFGQLIGLMDDNGTFTWTWFLNPLDNSLNGIPNNREHLLALVRALLDRVPQDPANPPPGPVFLENYIWEPIALGPVQAGVVWNNKPDPIQIGIGSKAAFGSGKQTLEIELIARLLKITPGLTPQVNGQLGQFRVLGFLPVPNFLDSASIEANINNGATVNLNVASANSNRAFVIPNNFIVWDCARLAVFVFRAWIAYQAQQSMQAAAGGGGQATNVDNFYTRVDEHFFPALGEGAQAGDPIQPFPIIGDTPGTDPNFSNWQNSVLTLSNNGAGAITFLWHMRALVTGNESPDLFSGSFFFPLVGEPAQPQATEPIPGVPGFGSLGNYETTQHPKSVFVGVTGNPGGGTHDLVVDIHDGAGAKQRIVLASMNGSFTRPPLPNAGTVAWTQLSDFITSHSPYQAGDHTVTASAANGGVLFNLFTETVSNAGPFSGAYGLELFLRPNSPVSFRFQTPLAPNLELPPTPQSTDPAVLFTGLLNWILGQVPLDPDSPTDELVKALVSVIGSAITTNNAPQLEPLINAALNVLGEIDLGPVSLEMNGDVLQPGLDLGPIKPGDLNLPIHIGRFEAKAGVNVKTGSLASAQLSFWDLRFGKGMGADASGLVGSLLPDMRQTPGFNVALALDMAQGKVKLTGGGKVPLQETIGPLELAGLLVDIRQDLLRVGLDLSFRLAAIQIAAYELGVEFPFKAGSTPTPFLNGLSLSLDMPAVKLAGMFAKLKTGANTSDYVGGAVVRVANLFQLSAIGGYTQLPGDKASLFLFASLVAPLGGPPWFFITGIAGGFGYNRTLPPPGLLTKHPFIQIMRGDLDVSGSATESLLKLGVYFAAIEGQHWVAAGIQFLAFGFINGKLVVSIAFGDKFAVQVLGLAAFGIEHIAYFEIGIEASGNDEVFKLKAGLSKNSYIIHPDIARLTGDFGLGIWHGGEHAGDFVLSIGGYHPYFDKPAHYDSLEKVEVRCIVYGFIRMSVGCFFACTPQALMAGASCSLAAEFAGIGCGLDVYIDVFMRWDPFYIRARLGVALWFEFWGRHEISVDLDIWTPPFGGKATIDLALVSFDVDFGAALAAPPPPALYQFLTKQLGVPAKRDGEKAVVPAFNTATDAGLFRIDFLSGRTTKPQENKSEQEGVSTPIPMKAEFRFTVRTKLPVKYAMAWDPPNPVIVGKIDAPLCNLFGLSTNFNVVISNLQVSAKVDKWMKDLFPSANFGAALQSAQKSDEGARNAVRAIDTSKPAIPLSDGYEIAVEAAVGAEPPAITAKAFEDSLPAEEYPLPFGLNAGQNPPARMPKSGIVLKSGISLGRLGTPKSRLSSREQAEVLFKTTRPSPLRIEQWLADWQRPTIGIRLGGLTVATPPTDAPIVGIPSSPLRRAELYPVALKVLPTKAPVSLKRSRLATLSRARNLKVLPLTGADGVTTSWKGTVNVGQGTVQIIDMQHGDIKNQRLTLTGGQTVRAIFLGAGEDYLSESWVSGTAQITPPERTRRIALSGEGMYPPVGLVPGTVPIRMATENIGVEHDCTLVALGASTFAGHGCVVECKSRTRFVARPLDHVPGFEVLRSASSFRIYFPLVMKGCALVLTVAPAVAEPGVALDEVRWLAVDAKLSELNTIVGPDSTAFVMSVEAAGPWWVEIDLGRKWRLTQAAVLRSTGRDAANTLRGRIEQDFIDDRFQKAGDIRATSVVLEVTQ